MRKLSLFLLLLAGWAVIFWPFYSDDLIRSGTVPSSARPSNKPQPPAWQDAQRVLVSSLESTGASGFPVTSSSAPGQCGETYTVRPGETLGEIARDCGLSLAEIQSANPRIQNPNRVYPGQQITLPDPSAGRGGAELEPLPNFAGEAGSTSLLPDRGFRPGMLIKIETAGLPPNTAVRIGLGLSSSGFTVVSQSQSDADGRLTATLTLPAGARSGDTAFIMVSTRGVPAVQRMSESFVIGE